MSNDVTAEVDPYAAAGEAFVNEMFPQEAAEAAEAEPETSGAPEGQEEPAKPKEEPAKPKEEPSEEDEEKEKAKEVSWKLAMARKKAKAAERTYAEAEAYKKEIEQLHRENQQAHATFSGLMRKLREDPSAAWDEIVKTAGLDPFKAFEEVARAKVGIKKREKVELPEDVLEKLRKVEELEQHLKEREKEAARHGMSAAMEKDHRTVVKLVQQKADAFQYAALYADDEDFHEQIAGVIHAVYERPEEFQGVTAGKVARAVDRFFEKRYRKDRARFAQEGSPAEPSAKPPTNGRSPSGKIPSNSESVASVPVSRSDADMYRDLGEAFLKEFSRGDQ